MDGFDSIAEMMQSSAAEAVSIAREQFGFSLDYSSDSVTLLETVLANIAVSVNIDDKEATELTLKRWGGYLGEVVRRNFGGEWKLVQYPGRAAAAPALVIAGSQLYPLMKIYRRLTMGESENVWNFYEKIRGRLSLVHPTDSFAD